MASNGTSMMLEKLSEFYKTGSDYNLTFLNVLVSNDRKIRMLLEQYKTRSDYNLTFLNVLVSNDRKIRDVVIKIQDWIRLQPHLPECAETRMLSRIWLVRKKSLERTKQTVDMYYTVRNLIPEFFKEQRPCHPPGTTSLQTSVGITR
uniref:Uncharacterized protein n=1 Tax=Timema monikensis TaxID=170555 RepID=A0A7R9EIJ5_9NEOP|nr:unnamed protein product [Timema monikensis]